MLLCWPYYYWPLVVVIHTALRWIRLSQWRKVISMRFLFPGLKPREIDLDLMGIIGARYCDSLLVVTTLGTDRLLHLYDRHCLERKGDFFTKGRGPKELLFPLFGSSLSLDNESGSYMMRFVDRYSDRLVEVNLSESIMNKDLVLKNVSLKAGRNSSRRCLWTDSVAL